MTSKVDFDLEGLFCEICRSTEKQSFDEISLARFMQKFTRAVYKDDVLNIFRRLDFD